MDVSEARYLINVIWEFKPNKRVMKAMHKMNQNQDSIITLQEFSLLCSHHEDIIIPLKEIQRRLRKKIVYRIFWDHITKKRLENFGVLTILEIRAVENVNLAALSMSYLNLLKDNVPRQYIEQWQLVQSKKAASYKGCIELPLEIKEKLTKTRIKSWSKQVAPELDSSTLLENPSSYVY